MKINKEYREIVNNILCDENFLLLKDDNHHGTNKYDHCKRVSYLSYLTAKLFRANVKEVARAGLLHDFFYGSRTSKPENSYLQHSLTSAKNATKFFLITENEKNIIETHMYHYAILKKITPFVSEEEKKYLATYKPKNKDGVIVCISDLIVSIFECIVYKVRYSVLLYTIFLINIIRC